MTNGNWTLRDLDSRNGTMVGDQRVKGDYTLNPGDVIRISQCQLAFVHDLSKAFPDQSAVRQTAGSNVLEGDDTFAAACSALSSDSFDVDISNEPTTITHRRGQTRFLKPSKGDSSAPRVGRAAATLCRLAFELAKQGDIEAVANKALDGLFEGTKVDAGAVWLAPRGRAESFHPSDLEVVATRTDVEPRYHRVSEFVANTVLARGRSRAGPQRGRRQHARNS